MHNAARRVARLKRAIARGQTAVRNFQCIREELERIRRATSATDEQANVDELLQLNAISLVNAERALAAAMANIAIEEARWRKEQGI